MKLRSIACMSGVLALAGCGSKGGISGPPGTLTVWTQGVARKIQPTTKPGSGMAISVATYRDAWASWQLAVHGTKGILQGVTVAVDADLSDGMGHTLTKDNVTFFREQFIDLGGVMSNVGTMPVPASSPTQDSNIPDPLVPLIDPYSGANAGQPFDVGTEQNQPVFIDIHVPAGTTAGTYTGTVRVAASRNMSAEIPLSVTVWDLDLPDMSTLTTHVKMSITNLGDYHSGLSSGGGPRFNQIMKRYEELAHAHRLDTGPQLVPDIVNGCTAPTDTDWTYFDDATSPYMDGSYFSDGVASTYFDVPFSPGETFGIDGTCGPGASGASETKYAAVSKAWSDHLTQKGWLDRAIVYAFDEPDPTNMTLLQQIAQGSTWLQSGASTWKPHVMDTIAPTSKNISLMGPAIGIFTVVPSEYDSWSGSTFYGRRDWPTLMSGGTQLWIYTGNAVLPPYATISSDTLDGFEPLIMLWGAWYERANGFLYWDLTNWDQGDPWGPENAFYLPGDGVMIYPGNHDGALSPAGSPAGVTIDGPIPSYRLKVLRQGLQDWALFRMADNMGLTSVAQAAVATVYTQFGGCSGCPMPSSGFYWKTDNALMATAREAVVNAILGK